MSKIPVRLPTVSSDRAVMAMAAAMGELQLFGVIRFEGSVDFERLCRAMRLTADAEPVVGCRYINSWWRPYWQRRKDLDELQWLRLLEVEEGDVEETLHTYSTESVDVENDPMVQGVLIRTQSSDTLCVRVNHVIADAGGTKEVLYTIARIYSELMRSADYQVTPNIKGPRGLFQVLKNIGLFFGMLSLFRSGFRNIAKHIWPLRVWKLVHQKKGPAEGKTYTIRHVEKDLFRKLKALGKAHQATLNDVILTSWYRAVYAWTNPKKGTPLRMLSTVDLRRYLPEEKAGGICNLSGFLHLNIGQEMGATFLESLEKVKAETNQQKANNPGGSEVPTLGAIPQFVPYRLIHKILTYGFGNWGQWLPPAITNMGRIFPDRLVFGDEKIEYAYLLTPLLYPPYCLGGLSGYGEGITLSVGYCESCVEKDKVEALYDQLVKELHLFVKEAE